MNLNDDAKVWVPVINSEKTTYSPPPAPKINNSGGGGGGGGGGSKKAEKMKTTKKSDMVERYKEIADALDDVSDAMEEANAQTDRMYGD
jgi:hypothetical protein